MKKTIILLISLASVSMGVDTLKTLDSEKLNVAQVTLNGSDTITGGNQPLTFSVDEKTTLTDYTLTFGFDAIPTDGKDPWLRLTNNQYGFKTTSSTTMVAVNADWDIPIDGSTFTINTSDTFALTVSGSTAYLSNLTQEEYTSFSIEGNESKWSLTTASRIFTNSSANQVQVGEVADLTGLTEAQVLEVAKTGTYTVTSTPGTPAVPEPATATLSLLALAGLAARRRRK